MAGIIEVKDQGKLRIYDADNSNYVDIVVPSTVSSNRTITIPDATFTIPTAGGSTGIDDNADATAITITDAELVQVKNTNDTGGLLSVSDGDSGATANANANELVLEDNGSAGMSILTFNNTTGNIYFGDGQDDDVGKIVYDHDSNYMSFATNAAESMRLNADGQLNLLKTNFGAAASSSNRGLEIRANGSTAVTLDLNVTSTGNTTIMEFNNGNGNAGTIQTNGSATAYNTSSDYRLKENVNYDFDATSRLKELKPARFNFKTDADTTVDGFIAHEVSSVVPEAISGEKDGLKKWRSDEELPEGVSVGDNKLDADGNTIMDIQGIDQSKLVPLLVKTIQELEARITTLENA